MPAPTISISLAGIDPKDATIEGLEEQVNNALQAVHDTAESKATGAQGEKADGAVQPEDLGTAAAEDAGAFATAAQGEKADGAVQPEDLGTAAAEDASAFATAAQGEKADGAVQPEDLGTAAAEDAGAFATAAQGEKADGAVQPEDLGSAAAEDAGAFATAAQGEKADGAIQPEDLEQMGLVTENEVAASLLSVTADGLTSKGTTGGGFVVDTSAPVNGLTVVTTPEYRVTTDIGIGTLAAQSGIALAVGEGVKAPVTASAIADGFIPEFGEITAPDRLAQSKGEMIIFFEMQTNEFSGLWKTDVQNAIMYQVYRKALDSNTLVILSSQDNPSVTAYNDTGNGREMSWQTLQAIYAGKEVEINAFPLTGVTGKRLLYIRHSEGSPYTVHNSVLDNTTTPVLLKEMTDGDISALYVSGIGRYGGPLEAAINRRVYYDQVRGSRDHPAERLDEALTPYGHVKTFARGRERLTHMHSKLAALDAGVSARAILATVSDSWSFRRYRWSGKVADKLFALYGDGGGGWTGFGFTSAAGTFAAGGAQPVDGDGDPSINGNIRPDTYGVVYDGTWTPYYFGANALSPDGDSITSTTAGDKITVNCPASPDHTAFRLFWVETTDGQIRYRVNGGAWTNQSTTGTAGDSGSADIGVTPGANTIETEVVSGTVTLCGGDWRSNAAGVVFHKLASSGSNIGNWQSPDQLKQEAMWARLDVDGVILLDGTNSQSAGFHPENLWKLRMGQVINRMNSAWSFPSVMIVMPAENGRQDNPHPMRDYAYQGLLLSHEIDAAFLDLQGNFGPIVADYLHDGMRPLMESDLKHPTDDEGGALIASAIWPMIAPY